ncbi:MAG: hypothetical protein KF911_07535 [Pseudomonadales bacterium]|nr:hypothetical protein [Pseudomonadales bacterium]
MADRFRKSRRPNRAIVLLLIAALPGLAAAADHLRLRHVSDAFEIMGQAQPAADEVVDVWLAGDRARMDSAGTDRDRGASVIVREDLQTIYLVDHGQRVYTELPMDMNRVVSDIAGTGEAGRMAAQMMGTMLKVDARVDETGETRTIGARTCRVYRLALVMAMGSTDSEICADPESPVDMGLYYRVANVMLAGQQGYGAAVDEIGKVRGLPVETTSTVRLMGTTVRSRAELLTHATVDVTPGHFEVPAEYARRALANY